MADGIRLHHPVERDCTYLVRHPRKDYYLTLDADGDVIVSTTIYERLKVVDLAGLMFMNVVATPPTQIIRVGVVGQERKVVRA